MKMLRLIIIILLVDLYASGCQQQVMTTCDKRKTPVTMTTAEPTTVAEWLTQAPKPEQIQCSLLNKDAPTAVTAFNKLSYKISVLYKKVYRYAQQFQTEPHHFKDLNLSQFSESATNLLEQKEPSLREELQQVITTRYQTVVKEIVEQQKAISHYAATLRDDETIATIDDPVKKTATLLTLGKDITRLEEQVTTAAKGASLVMQEYTTVVNPSECAE